MLIKIFKNILLVILIIAIIPVLAGIPDEVHPSFDMQEILLDANENVLVGGMKFMPDGRMVLVTLVSDANVQSPNGKSNVFLISGLNDNQPVQMKQIASNFRSLLGVEVIGDSIIVADREGLYLLLDNNGDDIIDGRQKFMDVPGGLRWHEFLFTPVYSNGKLYVIYAARIGGNNPATHPDNGCLLEVDWNGNTKAISCGLRSPNGLNKNALGELFVMDNQGEWMPTSTFAHLQDGKTYGFQHQPPTSNEGWDYMPPVAWLPYNKAGQSQTEPVVVPSGPFKDQFLYGDANYDQLFRIYLDKVKGEYQGAVFPFSGAMNQAAINRMVFDPNGNLYAGGVGTDGNWPKWETVRPLYKFTSNGQSAFEVVSVVSRIGGLELIFSEPVSTTTQNQWNITVTNWSYERTNVYGGPERNKQTLATGPLQISQDGMQIYIPINNMQADRVIHVNYTGITPANGSKPLWNDEVWYTLNNISNSNPFDPVHVKGEINRLSRNFNLSGSVISIKTLGPHNFKVHDLTGSLITIISGLDKKSYDLKSIGLKGILLLSVEASGSIQTQKIFLK